jgi:2,3-bisphosphoglycerate-independent phosphoglycerate mutase
LRRKQGILVIADGMGDRPNEELSYLTPLEYANTPNMDALVTQGACGNVHPYQPGIRVGTDVGHLAIFGYDPIKVYGGRGPIEAYSGGLELEDSDVAFRGNFASVDEDLNVLDRRAQRITIGTKELAAAIDGLILEDGTLVLAKELTAHRVAIVLRGKDLSTDITETDPGTTRDGQPLLRPQTLVNSESAHKTAKLVWELTKKIYTVLSAHPVNKGRINEGKLPANMIILRGVGKKNGMDPISEICHIKCACIAGDLTVHGIAKMAGMKLYTKEMFTGGFDTDYLGKAELAVNLLKKGYDWIIVHIKAPDLAGHDNLPWKKVEIAAKIDQMIGYLMKSVDLKDCYLSYTSDHSTPCQLGDHSGDPVPTIIAGSDVIKDSVVKTGESFFINGSLNNLNANDIFRIQMDLMGVSKKYGA